MNIKSRLNHFFTKVVHYFEPRPNKWDISPSGITQQPYIVLLHGYKAPSLMERHWFQHLQSLGYQDIHLYSNHEPVTNIVTSIKAAHIGDRPLVILGYSQGAFQAYKLGRQLDKIDQKVDLMVTIGAGGLGRLYPPQWLNTVRKVPKNVTLLLNFFAPTDYKGSDPILLWNFADVTSPLTSVENVVINVTGRRVHLDIARTSSKSYLPVEIGEQLVARVEQALAHLV